MTRFPDVQTTNFNAQKGYSGIFFDTKYTKNTKKAKIFHAESQRI